MRYHATLYAMLCICLPQITASSLVLPRGQARPPPWTIPWSMRNTEAYIPIGIYYIFANKIIKILMIPILNN